MGANKAQGSVFTEVNVPKFDGDLVLGGLSIVAPRPGAVMNEKEQSLVLPLMPLANRDLPANVPISAEVPLRIAARAASGPLTITTTLVSVDGSSVQLDNAARDASAYASGSGGIYRVALPPTVAAGSYRLVVEAIAGRARAMREIAIRVVPAEQAERE